MNQKDERTWGALVHLGGLIGMVLLSYVGNVIGALVMWLIKRNESSFIDSQGKEALNFQITLSFLNVAISILFGLGSGLWSLTHFFEGRPVLPRHPLLGPQKQRTRHRMGTEYHLLHHCRFQRQQRHTLPVSAMHPYRKITSMKTG